MKYQTAINRLLCGNTAHSKNSEYIKLAIEALEKQIPKKPMIETLKIVHEHEFGDSAEVEMKEAKKCPICGNRIIKYAKRNDYCNECGQAIDWSDEE